MKHAVTEAADEANDLRKEAATLKMNAAAEEKMAKRKAKKARLIATRTCLHSYGPYTYGLYSYGKTKGKACVCIYSTNGHAQACVRERANILVMAAY